MRGYFIDTVKCALDRRWIFLFFTLIAICISASAEKPAGVERFRNDIEPILSNYCYLCHGNGMNEGGMRLDIFESDEELLDSSDHWLKVMQNLRAGIMPPNGLLRPSEEEKAKLFAWIKSDVFKIDPTEPDPGRVTLRRLNRIEYGNTIRDLMGIEFNAEAEFPPDDTGFGFDNIGDVLSVSPLLLEKYVQAAETIVNKAVPTVNKILPENNIQGRRFRNISDEKKNGDVMTFYEDAVVSQTFSLKNAGEYRLLVEVEVNGTFDFDPGRCRVAFSINGEEKFKEEYSWQDNKRYHYAYDMNLDAGEHELMFNLQALIPIEEKKNRLDFRIRSVRVQGPLDQQHWIHPPNYERFFHEESAPASEPERYEYAHEVLERFASRAFRRPADDETLDRLAFFAKSVYDQPDKSFEEGIAQAMIAILASPRFLFRIENTLPLGLNETYALLDEYALASRLSYFFWSTMPDQELFDLAERGELRMNLKQQVERMFKSERSNELVRNFVGQWLQARDVEHVSINVRQALNLPRRQRGENRIEFDSNLRRSMRRETEMLFDYIMKEDRSIIEFIDNDYTFLNERLAKHYGIEGIEGDRMRKVDLPEDSPRGGVLAQGAMLAVTSNPTRTSPVKRGLFVLDNILGTPAPPAPPGIPELEEAAEKIQGRNPTMRELMEMHRSQPLCNSCHVRFDPIGMALENFNAIGMWRDEEHNQKIDASGQLITGEPFNDIRDLKKILKEEHRQEFYRCLTEKLLTYAVGRGPEYYDEHTIDQIVQKLEEQDGRFSALLMGIIESAPFQRQRSPSAVAIAPTHSGEANAKYETN